MFTEARARWLYEHYLWLEQHLPPRGDGAAPRLILPTAEHYPIRHTRTHGYAEAVFQATRRHMDLLDWPCRLEAQTQEERDLQARLRSAGVVGEQRSSGAAGTFRADDEIVITYAPELLDAPVNLVATLAHELCHYLMATIEAEPPGSWQELEPLTDLAAVREGFGVFLANSAFHFGQWSDSQYGGWQSSTRGYLNEAELGFALGIFCVRTGTPPELAGRHLKPNPGEVFADSLDFIADLEQQSRP